MRRHFDDTHNIGMMIGPIDLNISIYRYFDTSTQHIRYESWMDLSNAFKHSHIVIDSKHLNNEDK